MPCCFLLAVTVSSLRGIIRPAGRRYIGTSGVSLAASLLLPLAVTVSVPSAVFSSFAGTISVHTPTFFSVATPGGTVSAAGAAAIAKASEQQ